MLVCFGLCWFSIGVACRYCGFGVFRFSLSGILVIAFVLVVFSCCLLGGGCFVLVFWGLLIWLFCWFVFMCFVVDLLVMCLFVICW